MNSRKMLINIMVILLVFIISINNTFALEIIEPVYRDVTYIEEIDIGYIAPYENFLISFLLNQNEDYSKIELVDNSQTIYIDNTKKTKENIFTNLKIKEDQEGIYRINLLLSNYNKTKNKEITLKLDLTNDVITSVLLPYKQNITHTDQIQKIPLRIINQANSTKKILIKSDLPEYNNNKDQKYEIEPNITKIVYFEYLLPEIGNKKFKIYIFNDVEYGLEINNNQLKLLEENNKFTTKDIEINIKSNLKNIYSTKTHNFPLFALNSLPIYFFNNLIKLI